VGLPQPRLRASRCRASPLTRRSSRAQVNMSVALIPMAAEFGWSGAEKGLVRRVGRPWSGNAAALLIARHRMPLSPPRRSSAARGGQRSGAHTGAYVQPGCAPQPNPPPGGARLFPPSLPPRCALPRF
jgi:hypothetical protein